MSLHLSRESLVWTAVTQMAGAGAAALFFHARQQNGRLPFLMLGLLMISLVYLLYRFDRQRVEELKRAEAEKLRHVQEIADLHMNTIESLAIAIDAKDQTTHGHVRRTQIYALELGKLLGVSATDLLALRAGALLHDIGKLAVPEYILNKPGKLTAAEFDKMKVHTVVGGDIIRRVNFPYPVEEIVRFHHEKWDGTGYPRGLKGEQIPMVARIISVVDFYDATRCDRPYRVGMRREDSLALLRRMADSSFDPRVVETFVSHIDFFDALIADQDIKEQVASGDEQLMTGGGPDAGLAADVLGAPTDEQAGFRSIVEAQREVFALHEIAQTIGSSLNLMDTVTLVGSKLRAIVPFDTCVIYLVDERTGKAVAAHDGFVFATGGDGLGAAFQRSVDAVDAAVEAQRALQSEVWPDPILLKTRMGIHTGEAQERDAYRPNTHEAEFVICDQSIEIWFSILARKVLKRGNFTSVEDLKAKVLGFIDYYNQTMAKAFQWTYGKPLKA